MDFFIFLRSTLRRAWLRYPARQEALNSAFSCRTVNKKTGRLAKHYKCSRCLSDFPQKDVAVHHTVEVGSLKCFNDLPGFVERLFCPREGLQVVCKCCHNEIHNKGPKALPKSPRRKDK